MKRVKYLLIVLILIFISCEKDYLDVTDPNRITPDTYWTNENECFANLTAAYGALQIPDWGRWGTTEIAWTAQNWKTDEMIIRDDRQAFIDLHTFTNIPGNNTTDRQWFFCYMCIFYANQTIKYAPQAGLSEADLKQFTAEARFLRAYQYYLLVNYYRNVPLITEVPENPDDYYPSQAAPAEVWAQIEEDLTYAKQNLAATAPQPGRATKGAATALLGKAHMQQLEWSEASAAFQEVINLGQYTLVDSFYTLFTGTNENSPESIFEIQYSLDYLKAIEESQPLPANYAAGTWWECWPAIWLKETYLNDTTAAGEYSQRAWGSITIGDNDPNVLPAPFSPDSITAGKQAWWKKYAYNDPSTGKVHWEVGANINIIRYADVLLSYAEAQNEQGSTGEAINRINEVRARAGVVELSSTMNAAEVREHLREVERPIELAMERVRWLDLLRWDDMESGYIKATFEEHGRRAWANYSDTHKYYPIPQQDMDTNPNLVQNPGF